MRLTFSRLVLTLAAVLMLTGLGLADTLRLKSGGIIKGRIVSFASGNFIVEVGEGSHKRQLTFKAVDVQSITFDSQSSPPAISSRAAAYTEPQQRAQQRPSPQKPVTPPQVVTRSDPKPQPSVPANKMSPVAWNVSVTADNTSNGWTNTGWVVTRGQRIRITGNGTVSLGKGHTSSPAGLPELEDSQKLLKSVPTGALIAVVGDDNNDFVYIGASREFTAARDGALFLGINEGDLGDNSGSFNVKIEILPDEPKQPRDRDFY